MKVTVCFGTVRVVVPCRDGILVRDLIRESIVRYKKATGKGAESWVAVRNFKSQGGGILDADDRLSDVVDDREQIFVSFDSDNGIHHHVGGDGTSGSSDGTGSPELFKDLGRIYGYHKIHRCSLRARTDIEVTGTNLANGNQNVSTLQVRRGSEPNLTQIEQPTDTAAILNRNNSVSDQCKRWSAAPRIVDSLPPAQSTWEPELLQSGSFSKATETCEENADRLWRFSHDCTFKNADCTSSAHLPRNKNRLSMQFTRDAIRNNFSKPLEHRTDHSKCRTVASKSLHRDQQRKEPLGQANSATSSPTSAIELDVDKGELIVIRNDDAGPLGIHVTPDYDHLGKDRGLLVQGIDPDGRVFHDGRIALYDRIVEINGENLLSLPFQRVQEMFKSSVVSPELSLRVVRCGSARPAKPPPPPIFPRPPHNKENAAVGRKCGDTTNIATVSPTKKFTVVTRNQKSLLTVNTRKIGRRIELELTRAPPPHGLGFSITTRDNPAGGNCPIYIKNIIPKGAAIKDGRLKIGDRLLEVNDVEMTGKSQSEAVSVLRNVSAGSTVRIVVSRQEDVASTDCPRTSSDAASNCCTEPMRNDAFDNDSGPCSVQHGNDSRATSNSNPPQANHLLKSQHSVHSRLLSDVANSIDASNEIYSQPLDVCGDVSSFPWKYKHVITLDIPVHDSEKAGLGISVKGKTSGCQDLGIFIKSVIHGGAASRDQRLRTNDQLLNVNNISLLYQSNSDAMETLRRAMLHTEGPVPGNITLTIARKAAIAPMAPNHAQLNSSTNGGGVGHEQVPESTGRLDFNQPKSRYAGSLQESASCVANAVAAFDAKRGHAMNTWNPVLNKLAGNLNKQLRNESYYKATKQFKVDLSMDSGDIVNNCIIETPFGETYLMQDEYGPRLPLHTFKSNFTNAPTTTILVPSNGTVAPSSALKRDCDKVCGGGDATPSPVQANLSTETGFGHEGSSPTGFSRDAFGRQSMSEKRHAALDAKSTDTYQRSKKMREKRGKNKSGIDADILRKTGPFLGMKKSSSLESLETIVREQQRFGTTQSKEGDSIHSYGGYFEAPRSFPKENRKEQRVHIEEREISCTAAFVDPDHHSKISAKKHWLLDPPTEFYVERGFSDMRGSPRQSSLNPKMSAKPKHGKKKSGLLKGFGIMFR